MSLETLEISVSVEEHFDFEMEFDWSDQFLAKLAYGYLTDWRKLMHRTV